MDKEIYYETKYSLLGLEINFDYYPNEFKTFGMQLLLHEGIWVGIIIDFAYSSISFR